MYLHIYKCPPTRYCLVAKDKWKNKEDKSTMDHREMRVSKSASEGKKTNSKNKGSHQQAVD